MKKILFILLFFMGILGESSAQMDLFKGSFEEALKKAREEKKSLFVDFYADWCDPCKAMAVQVFPQKEVGDYFNSRFICVLLRKFLPLLILLWLEIQIIYLSFCIRLCSFFAR